MTKSRFLEEEFRIGEWFIHPRLNSIVRADRAVYVEPKVMEVLACLAEQADQVIPKEAIIQRVWVDTFVTDDVLIRAISELRRAFEDDSKNPSVIRTIPRRGYQLVGPVKLVSERVDPEKGNGSPQPHGYDGFPRNGRGKGSTDGSSPAFLSFAAFHSAVEVDTPPSNQPAHEPGVRTESVSVHHPQEPLHSDSRLSGFRKVFGAIPLLLVLFLAYFWYQASLAPPRVTRITQLTNTGRGKGGLATDGARIFFSEYRDGHIGLSFVSVDGGETVPLECPIPDVGVLDISPDGKTLLIAERSSPGMEKPLWLMPTAGGSPRRLGSLKVYHTSGAAWSPRGDLIAFGAMAEPVNGSEAAIYLVGPDGSNPRKLLSTPSPVYQILWAPDGSVLRFSLGQERWGEVNRDGSNSRELLPGWAKSPLSNRESQGTWTGDGKYFFFTSFREGLNHLWMLKEYDAIGLWRRAEPIRFTPGPFDAYAPLSSRDGKKLFYKAAQPRAELSRYISETGTLEPYLSGISAEMTDFSRDGEWVVYVTLPEASLVRSRIDGSERLQLISPPLQVTAPSWSPDGREIGFMARMPGESLQIYLISSSGNNLRVVQPGLGPSWSPDGRFLLFEYSSPSNPENFHILDLKTNLISDVPGSSDKSVPRWSPDGRHIAATAEYWSQVVVFELETQTWRTLAKYRGATLESFETHKGGGDGVFFPTWSHDGQSIYYIDWTPGFAGIYKVSLSGGEPEIALDMVHHRTNPRSNYPGTLGGWFGLAPDDSILVAVQASEDEIYAIEWDDH